MLAVLSVLGTLAVELFWLRTGIFRKAQYWIAMAIVYVFHVLVDGWLTKLSAPIVIYDEEEIIGAARPVGHPGRGLPLRVQHDHPDPPRRGSASATREPACTPRQRQAVAGTRTRPRAPHDRTTEETA